MTANVPIFRVGRAWSVSIFQILASMGVMIINFRAITALNLMIVYLGIDYSQFGILLGAVSLLGLITAIPGGLLVGKYGAKTIFRVMIIVALIGVVLPTIYLLVMGRATDFVVFTILGVPTGLAFGAIPVAGTMLVSAWFPPQKRPLPMGCAGMFVPFSLFLILFISSPLIGMASYDGFTEEEIAMCFGQSPAGFVTLTIGLMIFCCFTSISSFFIINDPKPEYSWLGYNAANVGQEGAGMTFQDGKASDAFKSFAVWVVIGLWCCYSWGSGSYNTYWPTYIEGDPSMGGFGINPAEANMYTSTVSYIMIACSLCVGWLLTRIPRGKYWIVIAVVVAIVAFTNWFLFEVPSVGWFVPLLILYGSTQELIPMVVYSLLPEMLDSPKANSAALGLLMSASTVFGAIVSAANGVIMNTSVYAPGGHWIAMAAPLRITGILALVFGALFIVAWNRRWNVLKARAAEFAAANAANEEAAA